MSSDHLLPDGWRLVELSAVDSTNAEVLRLAESGAQEGLAVRAEEQSAGRGRRGRSWVSPFGNLYLSILIDAQLEKAGQVGFAVSLALVDALRELSGHELTDLRCKWPNDLLHFERKVAGLLLESVPGCDQVVAGIGVNLVPTPVEDGVYPPGSLAELGLNASTLARRICDALAQWLSTWRTLGFGPLRQAWLARAYGIGESIVVRLPQDTYEGKFKGLAEDGALLLDQGPAGVRTISAGDVFFGTKA